MQIRAPLCVSLSPSFSLVEPYGLVRRRLRSPSQKRGRCSPFGMYTHARASILCVRSARKGQTARGKEGKDKRRDEDEKGRERDEGLPLLYSRSREFRIHILFVEQTGQRSGLPILLAGNFRVARASALVVTRVDARTFKGMYKTGLRRFPESRRPRCSNNVCVPSES